MKRVAPRTTRVLAALAAVSLLAAGVADGAHCAAREAARKAMPCCADKVFGDMPSCCARGVGEAGVSTPAVTRAGLSAAMARATAAVALAPFTAECLLPAAPPPRVERHAPPPVLRI